MTIPAHHAVVAAIPVAESRLAFDFQLIRSRRRTLSIEVRADGVIVRSPLLLSKKTILEFVGSRSDWVEKKIADQKKRRQVISKNKIMFLGKGYTLCCLDEGPSKIDHQNSVLFIRSRPGDSRAIKEFYLKETKAIVENYLREFEIYFKFNHSKTKYKFYKAKWGSCDAKNNLSFNALLCGVSERAIRYVVIHELCHTIVKNHSRKFWDCVSAYEPEYKKARKELRSSCLEIS